MKFPEIVPLETGRLLLRKLTREDAAMYYQRLGSSEAVTRYMLFSPHQDISESVASVEKTLRRYEAGRCYRWAITRKGEDLLMGVIDLLRFDEETGSCSFAYMLGEHFWGQGYGTEALRAVFRFAFREMEIREIIADHMSDNPASGAVMRKAGMTFRRHLPQRYEKNGRTFDAEEYRITKCAWQEAENS